MEWLHLLSLCLAFESDETIEKLGKLEGIQDLKKINSNDPLCKEQSGDWE